ncbi:MAG: hypothetical protein R3D57_09260 [Hyphomicrobiaceae bacterium]
MKLAKTSGAVLAASAAVMLLSGTIATTSVSADEAKIHCVGVNDCKGQSACKTANSSCKGLNACKGQGFLEMTKVECEAAGGTVEG